jgi:hypothetical protein
MFPSPIDLTVPDPCDQVRIVSRIVPAVASEGSPAVRDVRWNETCRKTPDNMAFPVNFGRFDGAALVATQWSRH